VSSSTTTTAPTTTTTSTTVPLTQASGPRTVLSPIGLNVRAKPSKKAPVLGIAAQGAVFQVLGHTTLDGGWYKVAGATATGWVSGSPALSAPGNFSSYDSSAFGVLYPASWSFVTATPTSVVFHAPQPGVDTVVFTRAAKESQLSTVIAGYRYNTSEQVVACGVTAHIYTYSQASPPATAARQLAPLEQYRAQVVLVLDATHVLGITANLSALAQLRIFLDFVNSVTFPYPQCVGGPPARTTTTTGKAGATTTPTSAGATTTAALRTSTTH
jgi:uncharacterized protein YgiM (DUF1202 family)